LLAQPHFVIWYDTDLRAVRWTAHHLTRFEAAVNPTKGHEETNDVEDDGEARRDSFRSDPRLDPAQQSTCRDYKEPIFDQGHMVPNAEVDFMTPGIPHALGMDQSFLLSNMTPQHCALNRGPWWVLEDLIRDWATQADDTWIVTGAVYDRDGTPGRDPDSAAWCMKGQDAQRRVAIPSAQYKIVARWGAGQWQTVTVLLPNTDRLVTKSEMDGYLT
jgi:endonuclease G